MNTELTEKESVSFQAKPRLLEVSAGARQSKRVVGRGIGSKRGKTAGRGMKGYKSRAGNGKNLGFEGGQMPLLRRLPKVGFSNFPHRSRYRPIKIKELEKRFDAGQIVSPATLLAKGAIKTLSRAVKVVGGGQLTKKLIVSSKIRLTASVKKQIEVQGGGIK